MVLAPKSRRRGNCGLPARENQIRLDPPNGTAARLAHGAAAHRRAEGEYQRKSDLRGTAFWVGGEHGLARRGFAPVGVWTPSSSSPRRRVSPGPPTGQVLIGAEAALRKSPEPLRDIGCREWLACPTERLRGEPESAAVYRFTS